MSGAEETLASLFEAAAAAREAGEPARAVESLRRAVALQPRAAVSQVLLALALIEAGALDDGSVGALAERLGVGARHLTRLFAKHVGASPGRTAQTLRLQRAKRLLDQTDLPMAEVAVRAGFKSLRRFNDSFAALYGRPPSQVRRAAAGAPARPAEKSDAAGSALPPAPPPT